MFYLYWFSLKTLQVSRWKEIVAPHHSRVTIQFFTLIVALERPRFKKARIAVRSGSGSF
jgi:hypothetical protein